MIRLLLAALLGLQSEPHAAAIPTQEPQPPSAAEVLAIPEDLRQAFHKDVIEATRFPEVRLEKLVKFVFDKDGLGIAYKSDATRTVAEAFQTRTVNCLSSTLLIVALAREAGLKAQGQQVNNIMVWGSNGQVAVQSRHANAIIEVASKRRFVVDVDSSDVLATDELRPVSDEQLLAYFYGNRAMELMMAGHLESAKVWLRTALTYAPNDASLWNNAGVLSLQSGDVAVAETEFLKAEKADPKQVSVLSNLVFLYQGRGDTQRAQHWQVRSEEMLRKAPYHQFQLGKQKELSGDLDGAIQYYRRAIGLNKAEHRFHFALAKMYFEAGKLFKADRELSIAHDLSEGSTRQRYQDKLAVLRRMQQR